MNVRIQDRYHCTSYLQVSLDLISHDHSPLDTVRTSLNGCCKLFACEIIFFIFKWLSTQFLFFCGLIKFIFPIKGESNKLLKGKFGPFINLVIWSRIFKLLPNLHNDNTCCKIYNGHTNHN